MQHQWNLGLNDTIPFDGVFLASSWNRNRKIMAMNVDIILEELEQNPRGHTLPRMFYTSEAAFAEDLRSVFATSWLFAGFDIEVPEPGAYISIEIGRTPIIVLRDRKGELQAYFNTCRHRGAQIFPNGKGKVTTIVCPYHQWVYGLTGELRSARDMPDDFVRENHALNPVHVRSAAGVIYVCLAKSPPEFENFETAITELLTPHDLLNAKIAHECQLVERANWKLVMENARECYHCDACHPLLTNTIPAEIARDDPDHTARRAEFAKTMAAHGLKTGPAQGEWWDASRNPLRRGTRTISRDGNFLVANKMCDTNGGDVGTMRWGIEPNFFAHALGDYLFAFSAMPTGPQETVVTGKWLVHKDAKEGVDYDLNQLIEVWDATNKEDRDLAENNQAGVDSIGYVPGPFNLTHESYVLKFNGWYRDTLRAHLSSRVG